MGLFKALFSGGIDFDNIASVVILEETQLYRNENNWGLVFSKNDMMPTVSSSTVPDGAEYTFSITYRDGRKEIVKRKSGTSEFERLLQLAIDSPRPYVDYEDELADIGDDKDDAEKESINKGHSSVPRTLEKNQLPRGEYIIGKDIPPGKYDFALVYGNGSLHLDMADESRPLFPFVWIGDRYDYESDRVIAVDCREGDKITLSGNLVVEILRSQEVVIDL